MILFLWKGCSALILKQKVYSPTLPNLKHLLWLKTQNWKLLEEWCCLVLIWWWRTFTNQQFFVACLICDHSKAISYPVFPSTSSLKYDSLKKYLLDAFIFNYCTLIFFCSSKETGNLVMEALDEELGTRFVPSTRQIWKRAFHLVNSIMAEPFE